MALAVGRRPPGLAHRVLGDGREAARARVRGARRRARPDLPPPRERDRAVVLDRPRRSRGCGRTTGCCGCRGEKMSKSEGNIDGLADALDRWGAETLHHVPAAGALREPGRLRRRGARAGAGGVRDAAQPAARRGRATMPAVRDAVCDALDDDFSTPRGARGAVPGAAGGARHRRRGARRARAGRAGATTSRRRPRSWSWPRSASAARARRDFAESDRLREEIAARGWEVRDTAEGHDLVRRD